MEKKESGITLPDMPIKLKNRWIQEPRLEEADSDHQYFGGRFVNNEENQFELQRYIEELKAHGVIGYTNSPLSNIIDLWIRVK